MIFKDIDIKELFKLMQEHDVSEATLQDGKAVVVAKRGSQPVIMSTGIGAGGAYIGGSPPVSGGVTPGEGAAPEAAVEAEPPPEKYHTIKAPLVGTFYRAPSPDAAPYVEVGDRINVGDVICIVEAMKSMNEIQADVNGVIKEICIENAQMVEFEQVMFKVDTGG